MREDNPLDFIRGTRTFYDAWDEPLGKEESMHAYALVSTLKNAVVTQLIKNRRVQKIKNLRRVLEDFISLSKKRKAE